MKRIIIFLLAIAAMAGSNIQAQTMTPNIKDEVLKYDVMFKWGFIEKQAGHVTLTTIPDKDTDYFSSILTGRSVDLVDNYYTVRDTLLGKISKITVEPVVYERIAHEGGAFYRDKVHFFNDGQGNVSGQATSYKMSRDGNEQHGEKLMTATGITFDMLSAMYYTRFIDYDSMTKGQSMIFNIFSGSKQERLKVTYNGKTKVSVPAFEDENKECYQITFSFTYTDKDKKKSSDPIGAWISTDDLRIPYQLTGKLPIGAIKCVLTSEDIQ